MSVVVRVVSVFDLGLHIVRSVCVFACFLLGRCLTRIHLGPVGFRVCATQNLIFLASFREKLFDVTRCEQ